MEFERFFFIHVYVPNSGRGGDYLKERVEYE